MRRSTLIALSFTALFLAAATARAQDEFNYSSHSSLGEFRDLSAYRGNNSAGSAGCDLGGCDTPACDLSGGCDTCNRCGSGGCGDECCQYCPGDWCVRFWAESLWLKRHSGSDAALGMFSQRDAGPSIGLMWRETECNTWEVSYFQMFELESSDAANTVVNDTDLINGEINIHHELRNLDTGAWFDASIITGFRYVRLKEELTQGAVPQFVQTDNDLLGGQFGGAITFYPIRRMEIQIKGTVGAFANLSDGFRNGAVTTAVDRVEDVAYVGQISVIGNIRVYENWWIRGGYQFMRLDGVATAQDHLAGGAGALNTNGTVDFEGGFVGFEVRR